MGADAALYATGEDKARLVRLMFDRIVPRYDLMNAIMTAGQHRRWRALAARDVAPRGLVALDLGAGTGDFTRELLANGASQVAAVDFSRDMLSAARQKLGLDGTAPARATVVVGDALRLPFPDATFDRAVNGFLLRNVANLPLALAELHRVLRPGGRLVCLELTRPPRPLDAPFSVYFERVVPLVGGLISGDFAAYWYLPGSLRAFPDARTLARMLGAVGFEQVSYRRLGLGAIALHRAVRGA